MDAPVSGGDVGAKNGSLVTMVGGEKATFDLMLPYLMVYSSKCEWMGEAGSGQHTKAANQIMVAMNLMGVCEALIYANKAGLNEETLGKYSAF